MKLVFCILLAGVFSCWVAPIGHAEKKSYTLQDLQALDQRKAWDELLEHIEDVPPNARQADWNRLVEHACLRETINSHDSNRCLPWLKSVLEAESQNADFAWRAGQWARSHTASWAAVPFFAKALKTNDARCADSNVQMAVTSGLAVSPDTDQETVAQSQDLAFKTCWPATREAVLKAFGEGGMVPENTCEALLQKGALSKMRAARCREKQPN